MSDRPVAPDTVHPDDVPDSDDAPAQARALASTGDEGAGTPASTQDPRQPIELLLRDLRARRDGLAAREAARSLIRP
jgi:hypothetical protein